MPIVDAARGADLWAMLLVGLMFLSALTRRWQVCAGAALALGCAAGFLEGATNAGNAYGSHGFQAATAAITALGGFAVGLGWLGLFWLLRARPASAAPDDGV